jgi:hypothetical protein
VGKTWSAGRIIIGFPAGHPQHGLEVVMRRRRIGEVLNDLAEPAPKTREELEAMDRAEQAAELARLSQANLEEYASLIVDWNFAVPVKDERTGKYVDQPVPVGVDGLLQMDDDTFTAIQEAYTTATRRVAPPLPEPSGGGEPSEEALMLPQEPLSDSP